MSLPLHKNTPSPPAPTFVPRFGPWQPRARGLSPWTRPAGSRKWNRTPCGLCGPRVSPSIARSGSAHAHVHAHAPWPSIVPPRGSVAPPLSTVYRWTRAAPALRPPWTGRAFPRGVFGSPGRTPGRGLAGRHLSCASVPAGGLGRSLRLGSPAPGAVGRPPAGAPPPPSRRAPRSSRVPAPAPAAFPRRGRPPA